MGKPTIEQIVEFFLAESEQAQQNVSYRYFTVAEKLGVDSDATRDMISELRRQDVLFNHLGHMRLNLPHLWKNPELLGKYRARVEIVMELDLQAQIKSILASLHRLEPHSPYGPGQAG